MFSQVCARRCATVRTSTTTMRWSSTCTQADERQLKATVARFCHTKLHLAVLPPSYIYQLHCHFVQRSRALQCHARDTTYVTAARSSSSLRAFFIHAATALFTFSPAITHATQGHFHPIISCCSSRRRRHAHCRHTISAAFLMPESRARACVRFLRPRSSSRGEVITVFIAQLRFRCCSR